MRRTSDRARSRTTAITSESLWRHVVGVTVGQIVEWFDWTVYGVFAPYFAAQFFPASSATSATLAAFAVFAVSFLARPLGGAVFGRLADRLGRRPAFTASILVMSLGMFMIAVSPTYNQVGLIAPVLLVAARLLQGLSAGGEMPTGSTLLAESSPGRGRAFYSSFMYVGVGVGVLLALVFGAALTSMLNRAQMEGVGWRIAFVLGGLLCLYGFYLRRSLPETCGFRELHRAERRTEGLRQLVRRHPREIVRVVGFNAGGTVTFYTLAVYMPTHLVTVVSWAPEEAFTVTALMLALFSLVQPAFGHAADRWGRRPVMAGGALGTAVLAVPLGLSLGSGRVVAIVMLLAAVVLLAMFSAPLPALMAEQFPTQLRASGIGLSYAIATALFGGTAPYLAAWLSGRGSSLVFFGYLALLAAVSGGAFVWMRETRGTSLRPARTPVA